MSQMDLNQSGEPNHASVIRHQHTRVPQFDSTENSEMNTNANTELSRLALLKEGEPRSWHGLETWTKIVFDSGLGTEDSHGEIFVSTSLGDVLDMLNALLKARREGLPLEGLEPEVARSGPIRRDIRKPYYELLPTSGDRLNAIQEQFAIEASIVEENESVLSLLGPESREIVIELVCALRAYDAKNTWRVNTLVLGVGNLINLPSGALLLTSALEIELPALGEAVLLSEGGVACAFAVTIWAPIWMLRRILANLTSQTAA